MFSSVGDSKTIVIHHRSTTHSQLTDEERLAIGVTDDLIRLSAGTEHIDDLIEDLEQAFLQVAELGLQPAPRLDDQRPLKESHL